MLRLLGVPRFRLRVLQSSQSVPHATVFCIAACQLFNGFTLRVESKPCSWAPLFAPTTELLLLLLLPNAVVYNVIDAASVAWPLPAHSFLRVSFVCYLEFSGHFEAVGPFTFKFNCECIEKCARYRQRRLFPIPRHAPTGLQWSIACAKRYHWQSRVSSVYVCCRRRNASWNSLPMLSFHHLAAWLLRRENCGQRNWH